MKINQLQKNIPQKWTLKSLSDLADKMKAGGTPKSTNINFYNGDIPFVKIEDITNSDKYLLSTKTFISKDGLNNSSAWLVPENSILYSMYASLGFVVINKIECTTNQAIMNIIPNKKIVDTEFLFYSLVGYKNKINSIIDQTTQKNLNADKVKNFKILVPPKTEQEKIAEILSKVDEDIEKTEKVIEETEKLKKGLTQELLINNSKNKDWETAQIKKAPLEMIDGDRGVNYPKQGDFSSDDYCLFLTNKNVKNDSFDFSESQFISKENDNKLRKGKLNRYDCILTTRGTVGTVAFYDSNISYENIRINSGMLIFRAKVGFDPRFLYQLLKSEGMKKKYKDMASGSAQPQLPIRSLESIYISYPKSIDKQKEIAEILSSIDEKIMVNKKLKEKLTQLKKGLMSDLLSGKVRIINN